MAKKSMIAREVKRIKTVAKFADKRVSLKAIMNDEKCLLRKNIFRKTLARCN